jgi:hypothetical protein
MVVDCHFEGQGNRSMKVFVKFAGVGANKIRIAVANGNFREIWEQFSSMLVFSGNWEKEESREIASQRVVPKERSRGELAALKQRVQATPASLELPLPGNAP